MPILARATSAVIPRRTDEAMIAIATRVTTGSAKG